MLLEWIIGAAVVATIAYVARGAYSSSSSAPAPSPTSTECDALVGKWLALMDPETQAMINTLLAQGDPAKVEEYAKAVDPVNPKLAACLRSFKKGDGGGAGGGGVIDTVNDAGSCGKAVSSWISTLDAAGQAAIKKAIADGDASALEAAASYQDGANPTLAKCIRAMKPTILPSSPVISSPFLLNPYAFSPVLKSLPLNSGQLLAALNTCMAGSGMPLDVQTKAIDAFNAEPTRAKLTLIANALRPVYPAVASCIDKIPA